MKRRMPEFLTIPLVILVLAVVFVIMFVADAGLVAMVVFGAVAADPKWLEEGVVDLGRGRYAVPVRELVLSASGSERAER